MAVPSGEIAPYRGAVAGNMGCILPAADFSEG